MTKEQVLELNSKTMAAFVAKMKSLGADKLAFGQAVMPRAVWAQCMVSALIEAGCITDEVTAEKVHATMASDLGNSSQLGATLVKNGTIVVGGKAEAATSFAAELAAKAAAKA